MAVPFDLDALDPDTLRAVIAESQRILRGRRLIADARARHRDLPELTGEELRDLCRAAQRFKVRPATLADEVLAARTHPQLVTLRSREGDEARLTPLLRVSWPPRAGERWWVITGNGRVLHGPTSWRPPEAALPAPGELAALDGHGQPDLSRLYGTAFAHAWAALPALPPRAAFRIILATAGHADTPQEALLTWCVGAVRAALARLPVIDTVLGLAPPPPTLGSLLRPALARVSAGEDPRQVIAGEARHPAHDWTSRLVRACELYLVGINLIVPDLETDPVLEVQLREIWERYQEQEQLAAIRAGRLRRAVARRFGFTEIPYGSERAWVRAATRVPTEPWKIAAFLRTTPHALVTEGCRVYVNGVYRCVVEAQSADLPHADQVVRRMLALATRHRERIRTLQPDLPLLEALFQDAAHATLWDLVTDPPADDGGTNEHRQDPTQEEP